MRFLEKTETARQNCHFKSKCNTCATMNSKCIWLSRTLTRIMEYISYFIIKYFFEDFWWQSKQQASWALPFSLSALYKQQRVAFPFCYYLTQSERKHTFIIGTPRWPSSWKGTRALGMQMKVWRWTTLRHDLERTLPEEAPRHQADAHLHTWHYVLNAKYQNWVMPRI